MSALAAADGVDKRDGKLDVNDLVRMFEESEEATLESRGFAERDRDYYDNVQLTAEELAALRKRGQPPVIDNRIKSKIDYLIGMEKQQRIDPRALPRTPAHEEDANGAEQSPSVRHSQARRKRRYPRNLRSGDFSKPRNACRHSPASRPRT